MAHKVVPAKYYVWNMGALAVLMTLTVVFGKFVDLGDNPNGINLFIALSIAIMKAFLIVSVFMGVAFSSAIVRGFAVLGFSFLIILFLFIMTDYVNPSAEWGTPYRDSASPGTSPFPGGQGHVLTGNEAALVKAGFDYVAPHHDAAGHGEDHSEGAEASGAEASHEEEHDAAEH